MIHIMQIRFKPCFQYTEHHLLKKMKSVNEHGLECPVEWEDVPTWADWVCIGDDGQVLALEASPTFFKSTGTWMYHPIFRAETLGTSNVTIVEHSIWQRPKSNSVKVKI